MLVLVLAVKAKVVVVECIEPRLQIALFIIPLRIGANNFVHIALLLLLYLTVLNQIVFPFPLQALALLLLLVRSPACPAFSLEAFLPQAQVIFLQVLLQAHLVQEVNKM